MIFKSKGNWLFLFLLLAYCSDARAQTVPVGTPVLEDYYRRLQLLGELDSNISFTVRPLTSKVLNRRDIFNPDATDTIRMNSGMRVFANGKGKFQLLPIMLQTQYNSRRPYGWNDGAMIPARGFQSVVSGGIYAKYGPLSIQLRPEFIYAENKQFHTFPENYEVPLNVFIDLPKRMGEKVYNKLFPGQSNIKLSIGPVSFGLSSENLWWGPGIRNSLLMSNTAPGFNHLTLNTARPIKTYLGSFEGQVIGGRLEGSGFTDKPNDWRYLSGMIFSYQPRWIPGLFLGLTRSFQMYSNDVKGVGDYFPLFQAFEKQRTAENQVTRDQLTSLFARWLWTRGQAEVYFEYGRGDHSVNLRDFILEPEHSRAYLFGFQKLIPFKSINEYIQVNFEATHLQQSINSTIRNGGSWYNHAAGIIHGYTHRGEVLGAGIGPAANLHTFQVMWVKGVAGTGLQIQRYIHTNDYSSAMFQERYTDMNIALFASKPYKQFLFKIKAECIKSTDDHRPLLTRRSYDYGGQIGILYTFK